MKRFTDIHTHLLAGLDDGARSRRMTERLLDSAARQGIGRIYATPHMELGLRPFPREQFAARLAEARAYCASKGYDIQILPGAELLYTPAMDAYIRQGKLVTLGESSSVLVEFVPDIPRREAEGAIRLMNKYGYLPILAHIERYAFLSCPEAARLKERYSVAFQVNCDTLLQRNGLVIDWRMHRLLRKGLIDFVASDAHNTGDRRIRMRSAYKALRECYGIAFARRLTGGNGI